MIPFNLGQKKEEAISIINSIDSQQSIEEIREKVNSISSFIIIVRDELSEYLKDLNEFTEYAIKLEGLVKLKNVILDLISEINISYRVSLQAYELVKADALSKSLAETVGEREAISILKSKREKETLIEKEGIKLSLENLLEGINTNIRVLDRLLNAKTWNRGPRK
jgi:hypothetical protein